MMISEDGVDLIKSFEAYMRALPDGRCEAYREHLGGGKLDKPTLGWGCTEGVRMGMIWTRDEAEAGLRRELAKHESLVARLVTRALTQHQFDALVSFSYNTGGLGGSTLLRKLNAGDMTGALAEFGRWTRAQGQVLPGLVRRRAAEAVLFAKADHPDAMLAMVQTVDKPAPAVAQTLQTSWTIWGALLAAVGSTADHLDVAVKMGLEGLAEAKTIAGLPGLNDSAYFVTVLGLVIVIGRRLNAAKEGKSG